MSRASKTDAAAAAKPIGMRASTTRHFVFHTAGCWLQVLVALPPLRWCHGADPFEAAGCTGFASVEAAQRELDLAIAYRTPAEKLRIRSFTITEVT